MARTARRAGRQRPRPDHQGPDRRDHPRHLDRAVRLGPPPLRGDGAVHDAGRHPRPRADGHRRGGRVAASPTSRSATGSSSRSTSRAVTASCASRACSRSARRPRCTSTAAARRCSATPSSTARCPAARPSPARPARRLRADQGARGSARRPVRVPVRRAADRVAGRRSTPAFPTAAAWSCWASARSATCRCRVARHLGVETVIGIDLVPERLARGRDRGVDVLDLDDFETDDRSGRRRPRADRRPRPRRGDRCRRHGGARLAGGEGRPPDDRRSCPNALAEKLMTQGRRRPARRAAHRRSNSCAAAARSRSSASTAA